MEDKYKDLKKMSAEQVVIGAKVVVINVTDGVNEYVIVNDDNGVFNYKKEITLADAIHHYEWDELFEAPVEKSRCKILNLFGGPSTGKSWMRARIFTELASLGVKVEEVHEFAKGKTWDEAWKVMDDQIYMFANQHHNITRVMDKVDVIVTDSPFLMSIHYDKTKDEFLKNLVLSRHNSMNTVNILLGRRYPYKQEGRAQTEQEAIQIDEELKNILEDNNVDYFTSFSHEDNAKIIAEQIKEML